MYINVSNLKKSFYLDKVQVPVLNKIDLTVNSGELISITGASGVGKSTLLHILGTLDTPSEGEVKLNNIDIFKKNSTEIAQFRNKNIGFVFQFHHLLPEFSALENVKIPLLIRREKDSVATKSAKEWLNTVGLSHRLNHKPGELSGGEQQRVALARALVASPQLLLADEPTGNLDEVTGQNIVDVLVKVNKERKITIVLVTHNLSLAKMTNKQLVLTRTGLTQN